MMAIGGGGGGGRRLRPVQHAVLVVLVASGARVADVASAPALAAHAVPVARLRHVVTYRWRHHRSEAAQIGSIQFRRSC